MLFTVKPHVGGFVFPFLSVEFFPIEMLRKLVSYTLAPAASDEGRGGKGGGGSCVLSLSLAWLGAERSLESPAHRCRELPSAALGSRNPLLRPPPTSTHTLGAPGQTLPQDP